MTGDVEAELYDNPLFSCEGCRSLDPGQDPDTCVVESCPQWKGVRWLKRVRDFIGNLHNEVAELTAVVGDLKAELDQTTQTYEGMIEARGLVIAYHIQRLTTVHEVAPYILSVFDALKSEGTRNHSDIEIEKKAIETLKWFTEVEETTEIDEPCTDHHWDLPWGDNRCVYYQMKHSYWLDVKRAIEEGNTKAEDWTCKPHRHEEGRQS